MKQSAFFSLDPAPRTNTARLAFMPFVRRFFDAVYLDCTDLTHTITLLKSSSRRCRVYAVIDFTKHYSFGGETKSPFAAYAILYDFVDGFLLTHWSDLQEDVDQMIHQRLYNDDYRPIFLGVESRLLHEEIDEVLAYSMLSDINGLLISNRRLLEYACKKNNGILEIAAVGIKTLEGLNNALECGADCAVYPAKSFLIPELFNAYRVDRQWRKMQKKKK